MFRLNINEGIKNISKSRFITCLSVFLFTLLFLLQSYTYSYSVINELQKESMEHETVKNYQLYKISEFPIFMIEAMDPQLFVNMDKEKETAEFFEAIENSNYVKYSILKDGGIDIENFKGDMETFMEGEWENGRFTVYCL